MRITFKTKAMAAIVLMLVVLSYSVTFATEPYSGTNTGDLNVGLPGGKSLSSSGVLPGTKVVLSGSGFAPKSKYTVFFDGGLVEDPYADASGNVYYEYTLPLGTSVGTHTLSIQGTAPSGTTLVLSANIKVLSKKSGLSSYPFTGGGLLQYLLIAGVALLVAGFGIKLVRRAR